jgi:hypothetical protein
MLMSERRAYYLLSFFIAIGLIIGIIFSKHLALALIFFSNIFFTAYSDAKILIFLAYCALLFIAAYFCRHELHIGKGHKILLHALLFLLAAASLFSFVYITHSFNLPFKNPSSFVYNGGYDTTVGPFHIHTFKPVFTWIATVFGIQSIPYYGSGLTFFWAFRELQPFYIIGFFLLLSTVYLLIKYGIYLSQKHGVLFLWVYSIFSYGVVKALVDGGPLWYEAYVNYALLCVLIFFFERKSNVTWGKIIGLLVGGIVANYIVLVFLRAVVNLSISIDLLKARPIVEYALFLTGLGLILLAYDRKKYALLALLCLLSGICFHLSTPVVSYIRYSMTTIQPQDTVTVFSTKPLPLPLIAKEGPLYWYRYKVGKKQSVFSVAMRYSHLFYQDIAVEGKTCDSKKLLSQSTYVSVRQGTLNTSRTVSSPFFSSFHLEPVASGPDTYGVTYQYTDCLNDPRAALLAHLQQLGLYSFVLHL